MNTNTINKLDLAAADLVQALIQDFKSGNWNLDELHRDRATVKYPTNIEIVKMTIRKDRGIIGSVFQNKFGLSIENIIKTEEQFNYLANRMVRLMKDEYQKGQNNWIGELAFTK